MNFLRSYPTYEDGLNFRRVFVVRPDGSYRKPVYVTHGKSFYEVDEDRDMVMRVSSNPKGRRWASAPKLPHQQMTNAQIMRLRELLELYQNSGRTSATEEEITCPSACSQPIAR